MEKRSLRTSNWLQAACLLVVLLLGGLSAQANITQELALDELVSGTAYDVPANTHVTATFTAPSDGTVTLTSTVDANTNLVPYVDADYSDPIESVRDEVAKSKTFDVVGGTTYYFQQTTTTTPFSITLTFAETVVPEITATWSIEEGAEVESFESVSVTFAGVDSAKSYTTYLAVFYSVAEDGTTTLVENDCTAGVLVASASGATITYTVNTDCYGTLPGGNYRIVLSQGYVQFNGDKENVNAEEYVLNFSIKGEPAPVEVDAAFTADPENNSTVTEIKEIVLTFTDYSSVEVAAMDFVTVANIPQVYMVEDLTGSTMPGGYIMFDAGNGTNTLRLYVDPQYTGGMESYAVEGEYMIKIPAGVVTFTEGINKEIILNYTVKAAEEEPAKGAPTGFIPEAGAEVSQISDVIVKFNAADYNDFDIEPKWSNPPTIYNEAGEVVETKANYSFNGYDYSVGYVKFNPAITEPGTYTIKFAEGSFFAYDDPTIMCPAFEVSYTVSADVVNTNPGPISITPADGETVETLEVITMVFDINDYPGGMETNTSTSVLVTNAAGEEVSQAKVALDFSDDYCLTVKATLYTPITEDGVYTITIPEGHIYEFGNKAAKTVPEIKLTYTIGASSSEREGIDRIEPAAGTSVESLQVFNIWVTESYADRNSSCKELATIVDVAGNVVSQASAAEDVKYSDTDDYLLTVTFQTEVNTPGEYTVKFPAEFMAYAYNFDTGNKKFTGAAEFKYTVTGKSVNDKEGIVAATTITPKEGNVESISEFILTYDATGIALAPANADGTNIAMLRKSENGMIAVVGQMEASLVEGSDNQLKLTYVGEPITTAGTYELYVGEGIVNFEGSNKYVNEEAVYTFTIVEPGLSGKLSSVFPPQGEIDLTSIGARFRGLSMTFTEEVTMVADDLLPTEKITITYKGEVAEEISLEKLALDMMDATNTKVDLMFGGSYSDGGDYVITIPAGWATFADGSTVEEIVLNYTIPTVSYSNAYTVDPEAGSELDSITKLVLDFYENDFAGKNSKCLVPGYQWYGKSYVIDDAGNKVTECFLYKEEGETLLGLDLNDPIVTPGDYTVVIPQGQITFVRNSNPTEDEVNKEIRINYTVKGDAPKTFEYTVDPAAGQVESLSTISVTFTGATALEYQESGVYASLYKVSAEGDEFYRAGTYAVNGNVFTFTANPDIDDEPNITEEGKYAFIMPQGFIKVDGAYSTEIRVEYQIGEPAAIEIVSPRPGSFLTNLSEFTVMAAGATTLEENETRSKIQIAKGDESVCIVSVSSQEGNTVVLKAATKIVEAGEYTLIIPKGYFLIDGVMTEEEYSYTYYVSGEDDKEFKLPTMNPEEGFVEDFSMFTMTWENATSVTVENAVMIGAAGISLYSVVGETETKVVDYVGMPASDNAVMLNSLSTITAEPGEYKLVVPAGLITVDGVVNEHMEFFYQYLPPVEFELTLSTAEDGVVSDGGSVHSVAEFTITFDPCEESLALNPDCTGNIALWTAGYPETMIGYFEVAIEGLTAKLSLTVKADEVEDGKYTILIPEDFFLVDGELCGGQSFALDLTKSGIYGIEADARELNVYNMDGILVLRNAKAADLKTLQKGIYIVNGKKILVR